MRKKEKRAVNTAVREDSRVLSHWGLSISTANPNFDASVVYQGSEY
jgi:hypothetical protein